MLVAPKTEVSSAEESIFAAALRVFARKGKDGARMHEIASEAELNPALLHYYFGSKEELYEAVLQYSLRRYMSSFADDMRETDSFYELLKIFIDGFVDFGKSNEPVLRLIMGENLSGGTRLAHVLLEIKSSPDAPRQLFLTSMRKAIENGELRAVDPEQTIITVISACIHFLLVYPLLEMTTPAAADRDSFIEQRKTHVLDLVYNGVRA